MNDPRLVLGLPAFSLDIDKDRDQGQQLVHGSNHGFIASSRFEDEILLVVPDGCCPEFLVSGTGSSDERVLNLGIDKAEVGCA